MTRAIQWTGPTGRAEKVGVMPSQTSPDYVLLVATNRDESIRLRMTREAAAELAVALAEYAPEVSR